MKAKKQQQKVNSLPLVALDLGSDRVRAMAAECIGPDRFRILGVADSIRAKSVERGVVSSTSAAGFAISEVLRKLSNCVHIDQLPTAFVALGGQSMQIAEVRSKRDFLRPRPISQDILDEMLLECKTKIEESQQCTVLGLVPSYFLLDGVEQDEIPTEEQKSIFLEAFYTAFVARKEVGERLISAFDRAGKSIECSFVRLDVLLSVYQCQESREADSYDILGNGCAVLDMGAQTTTLTIYKGRTYLANKVIPHGGDDISYAIACHGMSLSRADELKVKFGCAGAEWVKQNAKLAIPADEGMPPQQFTLVEVANWIEEALDEMLQPVFDIIAKHANRIERLYITGGASMLQNVDLYLQKRTNLDVRYGMHDLLLAPDTDEKYLSPVYDGLVGTILMGQDFRNRHKDMEVKKPTFVTRLEDLMTNLFADQQY